MKEAIARPAARRGRPPRSAQSGGARGDTRLALQDAAEKLFARHGFDAVSVRAVAAEAGVDPALLHYYFGTKRELFDAVLVRRLAVLNEERLKSLEAYAETAGDTICVEGCFDAFLAPVLWWSVHGGEGWKHYFALMGQLNNTPLWGAFAGGGGILRQARPDSRREILLVAAFYGRARKATAQFYPAMATHFEGVWPNAPILNEAERTPKSLCRFIRFQHGQPNLCGTSRSGPAFDRRVN